MFNIFAVLGEALISPKLSPSSLEVRQSEVFAEHAVFSGPSRLQYTGRQPDILSLAFDLHFSFCTPAQERAKLEAMLRGHQAQALVFGDGSFWGWFVLESLSTTLEQCSPGGTPWLISMQAELKEFTGDPAAPPERPAVSDGAPLPAVYPGSSSLLSLPVPSAGGGVWDAVRAAVSFAGQAGSVISQAADLAALGRRVADAGSPWEAVNLAMGGAGRLGGLLNSAGLLSSGLQDTLTALTESLPLEEIAPALEAAAETGALMAEGVRLAESLGADIGDTGRTLSRVNACLDAGQSALYRCSPLLQRFSADVAARKEV